MVPLICRLIPSCTSGGTTRLLHRAAPCLLLLVAGRLPAQTVTAQLAVTAGTTAVDSALVATGDGFVPTIAGTTSLHRDAVTIAGGATLTLASGADLAVKNDNNLTTFMRVGYGDGESGTLTIASGAALAVGQASRYANFHVAEGQGATGTVEQSGGSVSLKGSFNVGVNGGSGTYTLSGGSLTLDHDDNASNHTSFGVIGFNNLGEGSGATAGAFNLSGGTFTVTAHEWDPAGHAGQYGSVALMLGNRNTGAAGYGAATGTLTQTGGTLHVDNPASLYLTSVGTGTYHLNGGTLEIGGTSLKAKYGGGAGTYAFTLGGGTIKVIGSDLSTSVDATLTAATHSIIDTNGFNATWSGAFSGTGGLIKTGTGTLTLAGSSRAFGFFNASQGATVQTTGTTTSPEFVVGSGSGASGTFTLSGGAIVIDGLPPFGGSSSGLRVGDFGGTGTFTQTGGAVTVGSPALGGSWNVGNQGGTGTYNLSGGTLTLARGTHNLGRNVTGATASTGTLNLSGSGLLDITANTKLILGDRDPTGLGGTGTINQTGGTLRVTSGNLYLSAYDNGTYNLNGGTLEAGGSSLVARYAGSGTYAFTLGGGTIKVIGSSLTSSLNATLASATTSTLNTNGLGATWSGVLSGAGALAKTGTGTLTLTNPANTFTGATTVSAGTLNLTGHLLNSAITVASGGTLSGSGSAPGVNVLSGGTFTPGTGVGSFTVNGDLSLATGSALTLELNGLTRGSGYDFVTTTNTFYFGGTLTLALASDLTLAAGNSFDLFDWGAASGTFSTLNLGSPGAALAWDTSQLYTSGVLGVAAIPEPATTALLAGLAMLALVARRRFVARP